MVLRRRFIPVMIALVALIAPLPALAISLIRDAEIEDTLRQYTNPILRTAGLSPEAVRIFIVGSSDINAYVAGGANIFIYTGLIQETRDPGMLIGVIAHETGHIAGGHLARGSEQLANAQIGVVLGYVLGAVAAAAGGGDAGAAIMTGSSHIAERGLLSFSRTNEQAADQAALHYLDSLNLSADGMLRMFEVLRRKEQQYAGLIDPYAITHPLSSERVAHVRAHLTESSISQGSYPKEYEEKHKRMQAKLFGFMELPTKTLARYPESDKSVAGCMARAIAWFKKADIEQALKAIDALIADFPQDAYLHELKGQFLFENGRIPDAQKAYAQADKLKPNAPLIMTALAETYVASTDKTLWQKATALLEKSTSLDKSISHSWRLLGTAYGKLGNLGMSHLALAEEAALLADPEGILLNTRKAAQYLPEKSKARVRVEDLKREAAIIKDEQD